MCFKRPGRAGVAGRLAAGLLTFAVSSAAHAVDGVIEVNQIKALAGGVTATDTPGYPVTIDASGSYRLTGDLIVPDENTTAVRIESTADDVALDLNGFSIRGPGPSGTGIGISAATGGRVQIFNGSVAAVGSTAIFISGGTQAHVDSVVLRDNGGSGLSCTSSDCSLTRSLLQQNASNGIDCSFGTCQVIDNPLHWAARSPNYRRSGQSEHRGCHRL